MYLIFHSEHQQKRWSKFPIDLTSPSPFGRDLTQWGRGPLESSDASELNYILIIRIKKCPHSLLSKFLTEKPLPVRYLVYLDEQVHDAHAVLETTR